MLTQLVRWNLLLQLLLRHQLGAVAFSHQKVGMVSGIVNTAIDQIYIMISFSCCCILQLEERD